MRSPLALPALALLLLAAAPALADDPPREEYAIFSINVQDFSYPQRSAATVRKILEIHEKYEVPVDFYLTGTIAQCYETVAPDLVERIARSPLASVCYHVRPPAPYYVRYDWMGLSEKDRAEQVRVVREYETHGLDLATGKPTAEDGGYAALAKSAGYAPVCASLQSDGALSRAVQSVFVDLGLRMMAVHGTRGINLGDRRDGTYLRPEHFDLKLFHYPERTARDLVEDAFAQARRAEGARAPYFVGIKMHDNDFFAEESAWVTVYQRGRRSPPWDPSRRSPLLAEEDQADMWRHYESTVAWVAGAKDRIGAVNAPRVLEMVGRGRSGNSSSEAPARSVLHVSGTMHIETRRENWPDPEALVAFFRRATATGMRWSIGADIGWLEGEPRAREVIRATEALGVQWDVHAHRHVDRANCAAAIERLGGHPTSVASGFLIEELDSLRKPVAGSGGARWRALVLWGGANRPGHGQGADQEVSGVWRPLSAEAFTTHDPDGSLVVVGSAHLGLADLERIAGASPRSEAPVRSASIMVAPRTLTLVGTADGIDAMETAARRLGERADVRWATIEETARAWERAGGVPVVETGLGSATPGELPRRRR